MLDPKISPVLLVLRAGVGCALFSLGTGRNSAGCSSQPAPGGSSTLPRGKGRFSGCGGAQAPSGASQNVAFDARLLGKDPPSVVKAKKFLRGDSSSCACSHLLRAGLRLLSPSSPWQHLLSPAGPSGLIPDPKRATPAALKALMASPGHKEGSQTLNVHPGDAEVP